MVSICDEAPIFCIKNLGILRAKLVSVRSTEPFSTVKYRSEKLWLCRRDSVSFCTF